MRQGIFVVLALVFLVSGPVLAKDNKKDAPPPAPAAPAQAAPAAQPQVTSEAQQAAAAKQELIASFGAMRDAETRAVVLQQLFNEENAKFQKIQVSFCEHYKLDLEKWRQGLYIYDEKQAKFVEKAAQPK